LIREQQFGEALDLEKLEPLGQVHLERKLETDARHVARPQRPARRGRSRADSVGKKG
jgi:hypothetical protein